MLFDNADIELLCLTGLCKNLPVGQEEKFHSRIFTPAVICPLQKYGFLQCNRNGLSYSLTPSGQEFLQDIGFDYPMDKRQPSHPDRLTRRLDGAQILLTFFRANIDVFSTQLSGLQAPFSYLHGTIIRGNFNKNSAKVFAGCRFAGIGRIENTAYSVHYIDAGRMCYSTELRLFQNAIQAYECRAAMVFAGKSYLEAARFLAADPPDNAGKQKNDSMTYRKAYEKTALPVHLLECSDAGALQLRVMRMQDYRKIITQLVLGSDYPPPDPANPDSDSVIVEDHVRLPFVTAVDMDLKRIDRAYAAAQKSGYDKIAIGVFETQARAMQLLYQVPGKAVIYSVEIQRLLDSLAPDERRNLIMRLALYEPPPAAYITSKGVAFHVSDFPADRKIGKSLRPEAWAVDGEAR